MAKHLAIFIDDHIEKILKGTKQIEGRFSLEKIAPYRQIAKGDIVLLKQSGGKILGEAEVENVLFYENLDGEKIGRLRREYGKDLGVDDRFWESKARSRYCSLIYLRNPRRYISPINYSKRDRRPWVALG